MSTEFVCENNDKVLKCNVNTLKYFSVYNDSCDKNLFVLSNLLNY